MIGNYPLVENITSEALLGYVFTYLKSAKVN